MAGSPVRPDLSISAVLRQELPGAALPSPLPLAVLSRPPPSPGQLFKMHIRAVCHPPPEIRRWLPIALRVKSQVLAQAHTPVLGAHLPPHLSPPRPFTPWASLP